MPLTPPYKNVRNVAIADAELRNRVAVAVAHHADYILANDAATPDQKTWAKKYQETQNALDLAGRVMVRLGLDYTIGGASDTSERGISDPTLQTAVDRICEEYT
jgi:hypothetical protein